MKSSKSKNTKSDAKRITNKLRSLYDYYSQLKVASYESGYKFDEMKKLLSEEPESLETGIKIGAVKKLPVINNIKHKLADIKKRSDTKKKIKITKKADKKKISETKKKIKITKKADKKKISDTKKKAKITRKAVKKMKSDTIKEADTKKKTR